MTGKTGMRRNDGGGCKIPDVIGGERVNPDAAGGECRKPDFTGSESGNSGVTGSECRILGITGGVGAGKSTVLSYLKERYGAYLLEADRIGHQMQQPGEACYEQIVEVFGKKILRQDGTIDRGKLGAIVYADREKMALLNQIVHPAVKKKIRAEIASSSFILIVIEAALLLEDHYDEICDEIWYIYADEQTREKRLMQSRGYTREKVRQILSNQMSEEEFRRRCPVVIDNSGDHLADTYAQIDRVLLIHSAARINA